MTTRRFAEAVVLVLVLTGSAYATPVTYVEQVTGSGSLGGDSFSNAVVTLTLTGDTDNVHQNPMFLSIVNSTAIVGVIDVAGVGSATFTDSVEALINGAATFAGVEDFTVHSNVLVTSSDFSGYGLTTDIGPVLGITGFEPGLAFGTTAGDFVLESTSRESSFTTVVATPEPATLTCLGTGMFGLIRIRRKRREVRRSSAM